MSLSASVGLGSWAGLFGKEEAKDAGKNTTAMWESAVPCTSISSFVN